MSIILDPVTGITTPGISGAALDTSVQPYSDILTLYISNDTLGFKNKIIGGDFTTNPWSRGTSFTSFTLGTANYVADKFSCGHNTDASISVTRVADSPSVVDAGIYTQYCLSINTLTADTSITAGQYSNLSHSIDGYNIACAGFGQSGTRYVTLSFWHKHTKVGTYCICFRNGSYNLYYVAEYSQSVSNTWEKAVVTIPVSTTGTWYYDSRIGLQILFALTQSYTVSPNTWISGGTGFSTTNQVNALDTIGNTFKIALVQLELGSVDTPFEVRNVDIERLLCGIPYDGSGNYINISSKQNTYLQADSSYSFRNKIIGGDFTTNPWQRGTSFTSPASGAYTADRLLFSNGSNAVINIFKTADAPTVAEAGVFTQHCFHIDVTTADTSIVAGEFFYLQQAIEGYNIACMGFGQSGTRYVTLSFWVKSTKTGIFCCSLRNYNYTRSYVAEYIVNSSDTWEKKIITIPVDTTGTWYYDNTAGVRVEFTLACGTTYGSATANTWSSNNYISTINQVNALDSASNNFKLALIQLEAGTQATPFETRSAGTELELCMRYYERCSGWAGTTYPQNGLACRNFNNSTTAAMNIASNIYFKVPKRTTPATVAVQYDVNDGVSTGGTVAAKTPDWFYYVVSIAASAFIDTEDWYADAEF